MLQSIREHTQGWIAGTIISIIILTFALWGIHSYFTGTGDNNTVAEVNGVNITKEQLAVVYERLRREMQNQFASGAMTSKDQSALKAQALDTLVNIEVLKQASIAQGYLISDGQIDNYLQSMPAFQVDGKFSFDRFQEVLASTLLSTGDFLQLIRTNLLIDQPKLGVVLTSFALPNETDATISLVNQERDFAYMVIPQQYFLSKPMTISADSIKAYYEQHRSEFMTPEQVNVEYLQLSLKDLYSKIDVNDAALKNFYTENINSYTKPMTWKLELVQLPLQANASADDMAAQKTRANNIVDALNKGGNIEKVATQYGATVHKQDFTALNDIPTELQNAVSQLVKPQEISAPVTTANGVVIIKVIAVQEPVIQAYDVVKDKVKESYLHQQAEQKFAEVRDQLADVTYEHPESLAFAAKTMNLPVQTSELFSKDKGGKDISQYKKVRDIAFSNDVLNLQNNSDVIALNPESIVIVRVKSHLASALLPLQAVSASIVDRLKGQTAEAQTATLAKDIAAKLTTGADLQAMANQYQLTWEQAGYTGRYTNKIDPAILYSVFRLANPANNNNKPVFGIAHLQNGYAVVALKAVKDGLSASDNKQQAVFAEQVQNSEGMLEYELYKQSQLKQAKIKVIA